MRNLKDDGVLTLSVGDGYSCILLGFNIKLTKSSIF